MDPYIKEVGGPGASDSVNDYLDHGLFFLQLLEVPLLEGNEPVVNLIGGVALEVLRPQHH